MAHYMCEGSCHGVADVPGTCSTDGCDHHSKDLHECDCADGKHGMAEDGDSKPM